MRIKCNCKIDTKTFDFQTVPLDCPRTWQMISSGLTKGIFQLEKSLGKEWSKKAKPRNIEELAALISILRPGPLESQMSELYVERKHGIKQVEYLHIALKPILKETYGTLIYQEQVLQIARDIAGFSLEEADMLRKGIGKKDPKVVAKCRTMFVEKSKEKNVVDEEQANEIFDWIEKGQRYIFNKSHAVGYAMTSYRTAYCKAHFPLEFFTSYLSFASYKQKPREEIYELIQDARYFNIQVTPPNISHGNIDFMIKDGEILFGLSHIKGIGRSAIKAIVQKNIELKTWNDFLKNVPVLHRNIAAALIKSGACDSYGKSRNRMLKELFMVLGDRVLNEEGKWKNITGFSKKERSFFLSNYRETDELGSFIESMVAERVPQKNRIPILEERIKILGEDWDEGDSNTQKALAEKHYLGIPLSCSVVDDVEQKGTHTCLQAAKAFNRTDINICGVIEKIKITKTRNGKNPGQTMCFLTVADATYSIDSIVVFPNLFDDIKHFLKEDTIVSIEGEKRDRSIICSRVTKIL